MMLTHCNRMPSAGRRPAIQLALVSVNSPISNSVPMEIISAFKTASWAPGYGQS